jgi:5-formyltetrahydrofolate cyclo-ligase
MNHAETKAYQRKKGIFARRALASELARRHNEVIAKSLIACPAYARAKIILSYRSFDGEVDVDLFHRQAMMDQKRVAYPICLGDGVMIAAIPQDADAWEIGKYGIRAPIESRSRIVDPDAIDMVIVPCAAFCGHTKARVGMGAGYYDRYLPRCGATSIVVAYEVQHIPDVCRDRWDVSPNAILTEAGWYGTVD